MALRVFSPSDQAGFERFSGVGRGGNGAKATSDRGKMFDLKQNIRCLEFDFAQWLIPRYHLLFAIFEKITASSVRNCGFEEGSDRTRPQTPAVISTFRTSARRAARTEPWQARPSPLVSRPIAVSESLH
jgi:hypothetical protein